MLAAFDCTDHVGTLRNRARALHHAASRVRTDAIEPTVDDDWPCGTVRSEERRGGREGSAWCAQSKVEGTECPRHVARPSRARRRTVLARYGPATCAEAREDVVRGKRRQR